MKVWQCSVCKYIHKGDTPPEKCPICGVDASKFVEIDEASIPVKTPKRKKPQTPLEAPPPKKEQTKAPILAETGFKKIEALLIKHHAHPVSVHTPNGILPAAVFLWVLAWVFHYDLLAKAAFINLIFVMIALPFVIFTGILEWKRKYNKTMTLIFKLKILAATVTTVSCAIGIVWYLIDPLILSSPKAGVFILINIIMLAAAGIAGHIGGKLVFKD
jgi:rubredoxin